jgi:hypothetical protein
MRQLSRSGAETGGQWNFSGVLYQLLVTLRAGLTAVVEDVSAGQDILAVRIVVEPHVGGDAQTLGSTRRRVDQIKIRRGQSPWTTRRVVEDVLPDLFKAATPGAAPTDFRFVTDSLDGTTALDRLLKTVKALHAHGQGPADLDKEARNFRWGNRQIAASTLFERIVAQLAPQGPEAVWSFLSVVDIVGVSQAGAVSEIDTMLAEMIDDLADLPVKRKALCTELLGLGAVGASLNAAALLRAVGLDPAKLTHARHLPALLRDHVIREAQRQKYRRDMDVRAAPIVPQVPFCVFSGDSGQGKTWRLCQAALATVEDGRCAVLLPATGTLAEIEAAIIEQIWRSSFGGQPTFARVAELLVPRLADDDGIWLTVYLDDLADPDLATALSRMPWGHLGIRVVVSAQNRITQMLGQAADQPAEIAVPDFTLPELREYLRRAGREADFVPDDVLLSLLRPVLASIYCTIPGSASWTGVTEYQLIDNYWRWATMDHRSQPFHRSDGGAVIALAGTLLDGPAIYPWTTSVTRRQHFDTGTRHRLITNGVLREDEEGALQLSHSRLLNWVVAEEIARRLIEGDLDLQGVADQLNRLDKIVTPLDDWIGRRLGYVLHDLFWMLARRAKPEQVGALALLCVRAGVASSDHEEFFTAGLASLGPPILPVLSWLARQPYSQAEWLLPRHVGAALVIMVAEAEEVVAQIARDLVVADVEHSHAIGLRVMRSVPAPHSLGLLWSLNKTRSVALEAAKGDGDNWLKRRRDKDESFAALGRAVEKQPQWITEQASRITDADDAAQLIWLLLRLDLRVAKPIWQARKARLLDLASPGSNAVPRAIRHFVDKDELHRIAAALVVPDRNVNAALWFDALARLDPAAAVQALDRLSSRELWGTTHWWLPGLVHRTGQQIRAKLLETIGSERMQGDPILMDLALLYGGQADLLDVETFDRLIDNYEVCLEAAAAGMTGKTRRHLRALIASVTTPALLDRLAARAGCRFEALLTAKVIARSGRASMLCDNDGAEYRQILAAICGSGYDAVVLAELDQSNVHARTDGVTAAVWTRNSAIRDKLQAIAVDNDNDTYRRLQLMHSLAAHHADAGLEAMVRGGSPVFVRAVDIRDGGPPWAEEDVSRIRTLLDNADPGERLIGINLCSFLRSETGGALLAPLVVDPAATDEEIGLIIGVLSQLGYYQPDFLPPLAPRLNRNEKGIFAGHYLAWNGDADARAAVVAWLDTHPLKELRSSELPIAFHLLHHEDSAAGARRFLKGLWKSGLGFGSEGSILAVLAAAGDNEAAGALQEIAYQKPRRGSASVIAAIRTLQTSVPAEALAAAERFFRRTHDRQGAALLLAINAEAGTELILKEYRRATVPVRHTLGRLLRNAAPRPALLETLEALGRSEDNKERLMAAELGGWLPAEVACPVLDLLAEDESHDVELASLAALRDRAADAQAAILIEKIPDQPRPRQWAWLNALIRLSDPAHLTNRNDPRSIHELLDRLGDDFREEADRLLEKREKDLEKQAERVQQDHDRL